MLSFTEYKTLLEQIENISEYVIKNNLFYEDFLNLIESKGLSVEQVTTGDVAQITKPLMFSRRKMTYEKAPDVPGAEEWILKNKLKFKKRYGKDWEQILYATAYKIFSK